MAKLASKNTETAVEAPANDSQIFTIANYKGGVGKSTIAAHLAAHEKAIVLDLDINGDSARFGEMYGLESYRCPKYSPEELFDLLARLKRENKNVVIDCPPGESPLTQIALLAADVIVTPTRPGPHDVYALGRVYRAVQEIRDENGDVPLCLLCNFFRNTEVAKIFVGVLQSSAVGSYIGKMWERKEYAEATDMGKPVWESHPNSPGAEEMRNLVQFLSTAVRNRK